MTVPLVGLDEDPGNLTIGGKADGLRRLLASGMPVPPCVVIPAEAEDTALPSLSSEIEDRFVGSLLAIRSSGASEDEVEASFAGQYETVLNVPAESTAIVEAARRVRASAEAEGVGTYAGQYATGMAVLVMPMIDADAAGIAFTRDPVTGEGCVVVEAVNGLGDKLASGEAVGERWKVTDTAERLNDLDVLQPLHARAIAELARRCEQAAGSPQDIEWAIAAGEVVLLQSRAITTVDDIEPVPIDDDVPPGPWEWDSTHNRLPMTPLTVSVFAPGFRRGSKRLAETYGMPISHLEMRTINGYLYIQTVPPAGKPGQSAPPKAVMRAMFKVVPQLRQRRKAAKQAWDERVDKQLLAQWRQSVRPATQETLDQWFDVDRAALSDSQLWDLLRQAVELQRQTFGWTMVTDPAYLLPLAELNRFVAAELDGTMETTTRLLAGSAPSEYRASA
ncbi:MAG: PEP/pyruvate-binding domain-containing protein, partial [Acidimicrobiia bacterium]